jgi:serine/threonine protein phosphatase PrpC
VAALIVPGVKTEKEKEGEVPALKLYVANAGDSRSVLSKRGYAQPMSYDHKPGNTGECLQIDSCIEKTDTSDP